MKKFVGIFLILTLAALSLFTACVPNGEQSGAQSNDNNSTLIFSEGLEYELNSDNESYSVVGLGTWDGLELVIPSEYNGLPVTAIGEFAFGDDYYLRPITGDWNKAEHNIKITKVVIPNSVTTIGAYSFFNCVFLEAVIIPNSVTTIGGAAFAGCVVLNNITIPNSVQTIGETAFAACKALANINIPASVTSIGLGTFVGCVSLEKIEVDENNQYYKSISNNLYSEDEKTLMQYALGQKNKTFTIPNSVENVDAYAFSYCNALREITLSSSMTKIGVETFYDCYSLSVVNIPKSVESIEASAFSGCYSLTNITIPESVTYIADSAFNECYSLVEICNKSLVTIPLNCHVITDESDSYIKHVGDYVFYDDGTNVYLLKYLGDETQITLPQFGNSIQYGIYDYAFYDTISDPRKPALVNIMNGGNIKITSVTIPNCVVSIGNYAFNGCSLLDSVVISESVTQIGNYAFNGCSLLGSIVIPESVTQIGNYAFNGCTSLTIYCEAMYRPSGWSYSWHRNTNYKGEYIGVITTVWGYTNQ